MALHTRSGTCTNRLKTRTMDSCCRVLPFLLAESSSRSIYDAPHSPSQFLFHAVPPSSSGDKPAGDFYECPQLKLGNHVVTATAWSLAGAKGEASAPFEVTFSIVDVGPGPTVPTPPAPMPVPTLAPVPAPAPVVVATPAPVVAPTPAPVPNPAPQPTPPTTPSSCKVPEVSNVI